MRQDKPVTRQPRREAGEKKYTCPYKNCGKKFAQALPLVLHMRVHCRIKDPPSHYPWGARQTERSIRLSERGYAGPSLRSHTGAL